MNGFLVFLVLTTNLITCSPNVTLKMVSKKAATTPGVKRPTNSEDSTVDT